MACNDWEETALLYSSGELGKDQEVEFESHIAQCESCKAFFEQYQNDRKSLFSIDALGAAPSEKIDQEIKRVCESNKKQYTNFAVLPAFAKKSIISVSFFLIGFVVIGYLMVNVQQSKVAKAKTIQTNDPSSSSQIVNVAEILKANPDSADSINSSPLDSNRAFSKNRGNLGATGVVPVDLITK
jgi:anti-sigma factor RsiW